MVRHQGDTKRKMSMWVFRPPKQVETKIQVPPPVISQPSYIASQSHRCWKGLKRRYLSKDCSKYFFWRKPEFWFAFLCVLAVVVLWAAYYTHPNLLDSGYCVHPEYRAWTNTTADGKTGLRLFCSHSN